VTVESIVARSLTALDLITSCCSFGFNHAALSDSVEFKDVLVKRTVFRISLLIDVTIGSKDIARMTEARRSGTPGPRSAPRRTGGRRRRDIA
jgi:hypothetical protein